MRYSSVSTYRTVSGYSVKADTSIEVVGNSAAIDFENHFGDILELDGGTVVVASDIDIEDLEVCKVAAKIHKFSQQKIG